MRSPDGASPAGTAGPRLTCASLAAFVKYPCASTERDWGRVANKKHGFFAADRAIFEDVAKETGLTKTSQGYSRHPLAYLVEAADDICYHVVDLEDGFQMGLLSEAEVSAALAPIATDGKQAGSLGGVHTFVCGVAGGEARSARYAEA